MVALVIWLGKHKVYSLRLKELIWATIPDNYKMSRSKFKRLVDNGAVRVNLEVLPDGDKPKL